MARGKKGRGRPRGDGKDAPRPVALREEPASSARAGAPEQGGPEPGGPDRVHLLYVHGIGVRKAGRYVTDTMDQLATRLIGEGHAGWDPCENPEECGIAGYGEHGHGSVRTATRELPLTVQAFHWGADVPSRPAPVVAAWVLRSALALSLLQVVAPVGVVARRIQWFEGRGHTQRALVATLLFFLVVPATVGAAVWALWLLVTALSILVLGVLGAGVTLAAAGLARLIRPIWPRVGAAVSLPVLLINDALSWCSDDGFREWLIDQCEKRVQAAGAAEVVVVGHSQGASILTEWSQRAGSTVGSCTLITLGSGHGVLATLREMQQHRVRSALISLAAVVLYIAVVILTLFLTLAAGGPLLGTLADNLQHTFEYLWTLPVADPQAAAATMGRSLSGEYQAIFDAIQRPVAMPATVYLAPLLTAVLALVTQLFLRPLAARILERTRSPLPGVDVSASRDVISRPLHVLGTTDRVWRVPQTGTWTQDHVSYLRNEIFVAPAVNYGLRLAAEGASLNLEHRRLLRDALAPARYEHSWELRWLSAVRVLTGVVFGAPLVLAGVAAALGAVPRPEDWRSLALCAIVLTAAFWGCSRLGVHLFLRNSGLTSASMARMGEMRMRRRSLARAAALAALALPLVGAMLPPVAGTWESWVSARDVPRLLEAQPFAVTGLWLLTGAAVMFVAGSRLARPAVVLGAGFAVVSWALMGSPAAIASASVTAAVSAWCALFPAWRTGRRHGG